MSIRIHEWGTHAIVCVALVASAACSSNSSSPTAPSTSTPTTPSTPTPTPTSSVQVTVNPNPVPFSGVPITDSAGCAGSPNTWFYQQNLRESGGAAVTFTSRIDTFDQRVANNATSLNLVLPAMGSLAITTRWCSANAVSHTAQSSFSGTDAAGHVVTVNGPIVNLQSP